MSRNIRKTEKDMKKKPIEKSKELEQAVATITGLVKTTCGVANNAAWMACLEAYDKAKLHPNFRKKSREGQSIKKMFKNVVEEYHKYERALIYGGPPYFFRLQDLSPDKRKSFGNISDSEYYDLWTAIGAQAYTKTRSFITCLANKFKVSLESHGVPNADIVSWIITATACLRTARRVFDSSMRQCGQMIGIPGAKLAKVYKAFDMTVIYNEWVKAEYAIEPMTDYELDDIEVKNIKVGIEQLEENWMSSRTLYGSAIDVFDEYDEVWRTPGEQKKAIGKVVEDMKSLQAAEAEG